MRFKIRPKISIKISTKFRLKITTKLQLQNLDQTPASKSRPKFSFKISATLQEKTNIFGPMRRKRERRKRRKVSVGRKIVREERKDTLELKVLADLKRVISF